MAAERPFPPSSRRRGLARQSGLHAASPVLVGGAAAAAAAIALYVFARSAFVELRDAATGALRDGPVTASPAFDPSQIVSAVLAFALPIVAAAAIVATVAHVVQTRALWLPRRRIDHAPALAGGPGARTRRAAFDIAGAAVIGGVAFGWLWWATPRLAVLPDAAPAAGAMIASALVCFAIAWIALGVLDALVRHAELGAALRMTPAEKREDDRLAGADPRWRELRARLARADARTPATDAVRAAAVLVVGDDTAAAIAWDPVHRPIPHRTAVGRGVLAGQLLGLARRHHIAIHRDVALAAALANERGAVPEAHWARLAEIVAATRRA